MLKHLKFTNRSKRRAVHLIKLKHNRFTIDISKSPTLPIFYVNRMFKIVCMRAHAFELENHLYKLN